MVDTDDVRRMTYDVRRTMPRVWHKLPTGELTSKNNIKHKQMKTYHTELLFLRQVQFGSFLNLLVHQ